MWGCMRGSWMPAWWASEQSRRVAACLSMRFPVRLSRMGPRARSAGAVDGAGDRWRQWREDDLVALAMHAQHSMAVAVAEVFDAGSGGLEDSQSEEAEH